MVAVPAHDVTNVTIVVEHSHTKGFRMGFFSGDKKASRWGFSRFKLGHVLTEFKRGNVV